MGLARWVVDPQGSEDIQSPTILQRGPSLVVLLSLSITHLSLHSISLWNMLGFAIVASALARAAHGQTIDASSAASVAASTTVSQQMPPAATASFDPAEVSSTDACERIFEVHFMVQELADVSQLTGVTLNSIPVPKYAAELLQLISVTM